MRATERAGSLAYSQHEPLGPIRLLVLRCATEAVGLRPEGREQTKDLYHLPNLTNCWLVEFDGLRLLERPRVWRKCFGKMAEVVDVPNLDTETRMTHKLHKLPEADWLIDVLESQKPQVWSVDGIAVRFNLPEPPKTKGQLRTAEKRKRKAMFRMALAMRNAEVGDGLDWLRRLSFRGAAYRRPPTPKSTTIISNSRAQKPKMRHWKVRPKGPKLAPDQVVPWNLGWHVGHPEECAKFIDMLVSVPCPEEKKYGKVVAERIHFEPKEDAFWREQYRFDRNEAKLYLYRTMIKPEDMGEGSPLLREYMDDCRAAAKRKLTKATCLPPKGK